MKSLPGSEDARPRKRKQVEVKVATVAHNIEAKPRTEDVKLSDKDVNKDFESLMLSELVLKGLRESGFVRPSPVQLAAIPNAKIGLDMIVQSKSGTGKTCVYVVTALEMLKRELPGLQVLVIAPTREIAMQGLEVASQIGANMPGLKIASFIGGLPVSEDKIKAVNCQMAIGTPGRLKQLFTENVLNADTIRLVILDEADKLLEQSFLADTTHLLNLLPSSKQVMALSATYPNELARMAEKFMRSPQHIRLAQENQVLFGVAQVVQLLENSASQPKQNQIKQAALIKVLSSVPYNQCLIFSNYQVLAQSTADFLNSRGFPSICISAGQDQVRRLQAIQSFKTFKCRILCSTDLTARGIDAENVNLVINYDIPDDHNTYLHRIGRGGRFGSSSIAVSLAPEGKEEKRLRKIVFRTGSSIKILPNETLPKNIRGEALPLLEGAEPEADIEVKGNDDEGETEVKVNRAVKKSGKIKRRGKKKSMADKDNEKVAEDQVEELNGLMENSELEENVDRNEINNIIETSKRNIRRIENCEQLDDLINGKESLIIDGQLDTVNAVKKVTKRLVQTQVPNGKYDEAVKNSKQHLGYRSAKDVLQFIASNSTLPDKFEFLNVSQNEAEVTKMNDKSHPPTFSPVVDNSEVEDESSSSESDDQQTSEDSQTSSSDSESEDGSNHNWGYAAQHGGYTAQHPNSYAVQHNSGYSAQQLQQWYADVASRSRQIEAHAYYMTLQNLQQHFGRRH